MSATNLSAVSIAGLPARTGAIAEPGRVLLITNQFPPNHGGSASVYAALAQHGGGRVMVLTPSLDYRSGREIDGWRAHDRAARGPVRRIRLLRTLLGPAGHGLAARIRGWMTDLVLRAVVFARVLGLIYCEHIGAVCIGEVLASGWMVPLLRLIGRVPVAVYIHGEEILTEDGYDRGHRRAARTMAAADRVIVVSHFSRVAAKRLLPERAAAKLALITNGVDTARFHPGLPDAALLARYGLEGGFVFITVSRLLEKKGVDTAILALAALLPRHPDCRLLVVGTGPMETELRALAHRLGLTGRVVFAGHVADDDLAAHYRLGDAFVLANRTLPNGDTEGFGLVLLEASACGLPVIGGRDGGTGSAVIDGETGLLVDAHSVPAVAAAMARLREDDGMRSRMGRAGAAFAAQSGWQEKARDFLDLCLEAG